MLAAASASASAALTPISASTSRVCSPSAGASRASRAAPEPNVIAGPSTGRPAELGKVANMPRACSCGSASTSATVATRSAGTPASRSRASASALLSPAAQAATAA